MATYIFSGKYTTKAIKSISTKRTEDTKKMMNSSEAFHYNSYTGVQIY